MNWKNFNESFDIYINGSCVRRTYSRNKAINLDQKWCGQLFEQRKVEVVNTISGEVIYQLN